MKNQILKAVETKNSGLFIESIANYVEEIVKGLDDYTVNALTIELKALREGKKGRVVSPFTVEKVTVSSGKRGRPSLSSEAKIAKLEAQLNQLKVSA